MTTHDTPEPCVKCGGPVDWEEHRKANGWPTPNHIRRTADALDVFTPAKYGDVLRWVADACDAALRVPAMTTHDTPEAALAAALHDSGECENWEPGYWYPDPLTGRRLFDAGGDAAAHLRSAQRILAAMPDWVLVPTKALKEICALSGISNDDLSLIIKSSTDV